MIRLRKLALWAAGVIVVGIIIALLIWPEQVSSFGVILGLLAATLGAFGISGQKQE